MGMGMEWGRGRGGVGEGCGFGTIITWEFLVLTLVGICYSSLPCANKSSNYPLDKRFTRDIKMYIENQVLRIKMRRLDLPPPPFSF